MHIKKKGNGVSTSDVIIFMNRRSCSTCCVVGRKTPPTCMHPKRYSVRHQWQLEPRALHEKYTTAKYTLCFTFDLQCAGTLFGMLRIAHHMSLFQNSNFFPVFPWLFRYQRVNFVTHSTIVTLRWACNTYASPILQRHLADFKCDDQYNHASYIMHSINSPENAFCSTCVCTSWLILRSNSCSDVWIDRSTSDLDT